jgi:hypothetical protein
LAIQRYGQRHDINNGKARKAKLRVQYTPRSVDYILAILRDDPVRR